MTVSAHKKWAWGGTRDGVKSHAAIMDRLIRCAGGDGNMVLNVGPRPDGVIDPEQANRLREVGAWLQKYGESIYGTRGGPYMPDKRLVSTRKDKIVYLHLLVWPKTGDFRLPALPARIKSATLLNGGPVEIVVDGNDFVIKIAPEHRRDFDTLVKLELDQPALEITPIQLPGAAVPAK
jgi:alpha-L-fucosidase